MRRLAALVSLAVLAAILVARRRRAPAPPLAPPAPRSAFPAQPAALPLPAEPLPAAPAPPVDSAFLSVAWELGDAPADGAELQVRCQLDADLALDRVDVQETPTQVFVTALACLVAPATGAPGARQQEATARLSGPLGTRELIHAPVDERTPPSL